MMSFAYREPGAGSPPLYDGTQDPWTPVSIVWRPEIWDCSRVKKAGDQSLVEKPSIDWSLNIGEIWVESRKTYEILCRLPRPAGMSPLVRIVPPALPNLRQSRKLYDCVICTAHEPDLDLAYDICAKVPAIIAHGPKHWGLMAYAKTVVFAIDRLGPLYWLAYAIAADCRIVSSDAGAAEEYLCKAGRPGSWLVIHHGLDARGYIEGVRFLSGQKAECHQTSYLDMVPWVAPWKDKKDSQHKHERDTAGRRPGELENRKGAGI